MSPLYAALAIICLASRASAGIVNDACSSNSDCSGTTGAYCSPKPQSCQKGYCVCPAGQSVVGTTCTNVQATTPPTMKAKLGQSCSVSSDCQGNYTSGVVCTSGSCVCGTTYRVQASNGYDCQPYSNGNTCSGSAACGVTSYGDCSSGTCKCQSTYTWVNSGDVGSVGGCFSSSATKDLGQGSTGCTGSSWYANPSSASFKFCSANLYCSTCPEGGAAFCNTAGGASSLAVATVAVVLTTVCGLLVGKL